MLVDILKIFTQRKNYCLKQLFGNSEQFKNERGGEKLKCYHVLVHDNKKIIGG
jgi:hypothetical protein